MYIIIFEDGEVSKSVEIDESLREACDMGILDVIDISNPEAPVSYYEGEWVELPDADTGL